MTKINLYLYLYEDQVHINHIKRDISNQILEKKYQNVYLIPFQPCFLNYYKIVLVDFVKMGAKWEHIKFLLIYIV